MSDTLNLRHIKIKKCPYCGEGEIRSEGRTGRHVSGEWFEFRQFECGLKLEYIANYFRKIKETSECSRSKESKEKERKRTVFKKKLYNYVLKSDTDDKFKAKILETLNL